MNDNRPVPGVDDIRTAPLHEIIKLYASLSSPPLSRLKGKFRAEFIGPWWYRHTAGYSLAPVGLRQWWGKEFDGHGTGFNLVRRDRILSSTLAMTVEQRNSVLDEKPGLTITYPAETPFPWPNIIDEVRQLTDTCLLCLTQVNLPGIKAMLFPFLLHACPDEEFYDFIVIGSGFGGSVAALRLAEKGYRVAVLEQGREISDQDMEKASQNPLKLFWRPALGLKGYFSQDFFPHLNLVRGVGVGGGSLVYAAVLLEPGSEFYGDLRKVVPDVDWKQSLEPHYKTAKHMLGVTTNPYLRTMDEYLQQTAQAMKAAHTFGPVPLGIYFGTPDQEVPDPYFNGQGPVRTGCNECGLCLSGCYYGAKNSLDKNYLHLARLNGARVFPEKKVTLINPRESGGGYSVHMIHPFDRKKVFPPMHARNVVLAAGVLGTLTLLFRCRDKLKTLPNLSPQLGKVVRTNSESIVGILSQDHNVDLTQGPAISSHFYPDDKTHITQNRFPPAYTIMKTYCGPLIDDPSPWRRMGKTIRTMLLHPWQSSLSWRIRHWYKRISVLTVMQHMDNWLTFRWKRSLLNAFRPGLTTSVPQGRKAPAYLPIANDTARAFAKISGGIPLNVLMESILNQSTTAHILGGCPIGHSLDTGVIDHNHRVFGYPGLYVTDATAIPVNLGVNPSLTIVAMTERCMTFIPIKPGSDQKSCS
ncbi:GMC oxidoreductase [candidate division CSSED10-310 bacterium]|uniref:Cholesterol oxidase n=1 Tax=candidate division CSSED10-310 bacterium TaxID=2855610 RepID=A0ABV6YU39_UNCC1